MKFFGVNSKRKGGERAALDEFSFHVPAEEIKPSEKRIEVECFKKKRVFKPNMISQHINSLESLKSDSDSDYDSMPRSEESELCISLSKFRLEDTLPHYYERIPSPVSTTSSDYGSCESAHRRLHECNPIDSNDSMIDAAQLSCAVTKVMLYPEEEWARNAKSIQWTIKFNRWWKSLCIVTETSVGGSYVKSAEAKVVHNSDGSLTITGRFKRLENPDFKLELSTNLSRHDMKLGYAMTGDLHQGDLARFGKLDITHFAAINKDQC